MIEIIEGAPEGILAFRAAGKVEASDYEVLRPAVEKGIAEKGKVRIVFEMGPEFEGYTAGAAWEDAKLWAPHLTSWERWAAVTDHKFMADALKVFGHIMPGEIKVFAAGELQQAMEWASG